MIKIIIPGRPVPKGRPRLGYRGRKAFVYTPPETKEYEKIVGWIAKTVCKKPLTGPVVVEIDVYVTGHAGDWDNYGKSISDGLNGVAWEDDSQIIDGRVRKHRCKKRSEERAEVVIREVS